MNFKVGDRVKCIKQYMGRVEAVGVCGTVKTIEGGEDHPIGVEFDKRINGHDCCNTCKDECGWWLPDSTEYLSLIDEIKVGDIVKAVKRIGSNSVKGMVGIVRVIKGSMIPYGVEWFGDKIEGHNLEEKLEEKKGWWCSNSEIKRIDKKLKHGYEIGDIVEYTRPIGSVDEGDIGIIIKKGDDEDTFGVWWKRYCEKGEGHTLYSDEPVRKGGWYVGYDDIRLVKHQTDEKPKEEKPSKCVLTKEPVKPKLQVKQGYIWIARDKDGKLFAYKEKPVRDVGGTQWYGREFCMVKETECKAEIKWEDDPVELKEE